MGLFGFGKKEKDKMKDGLEKTRTGFWGNILNTLTGSKIDDDLYDELEEQLILADVGGDVAMKLVDALRDRVQEKGLKTGEQAADALRDIIADEMRPETEMALDGHPAVILVIGVNGVDRDFGLSTASELEAATKIAAMAQARESYCLSEHSKFGKTALYKLCPLAAVHCIVTDSGLDPDLRQEYGALTHLLIAQ